MNGNFAGLGEEGVGVAGIVDERGIAEAKSAFFGDKTVAAIAEAVNVRFEVGGWLHEEFIGSAKIGRAGRMNVEERDHGDRGRDIELDVKAESLEEWFHRGIGNRMPIAGRSIYQ